MAKQVINIGTAPNDSTGDSLREGGDKINDNFDEIYESLNHGVYNYQNTIGDVSYTSGSELYLNNDGLGTLTDNTYKLTGIDDVYDTTNYEFDFTALELGDVIDIRIDLDVTTTSQNQVVTVALELGIGVFPYDIKFISDKLYKTTGAYTNQTVTNTIYIGNDTTKDNPAKLKISSDANATVNLNGFSVISHKRKQLTI